MSIARSISITGIFVSLAACGALPSSDSIFEPSSPLYKGSEVSSPLKERQLAAKIPPQTIPAGGIIYPTTSDCRLQLS